MANIQGCHHLPPTSPCWLISTLCPAEIGWRAEFLPADHALSEFEFDVIIGADGRRNTLEGEGSSSWDGGGESGRDWSKWVRWQVLKLGELLGEQMSRPG